MIAASEAERAARVVVTAWPADGLPALLDESDAVVCCADVHGGRDAVDATVRDILRAAHGGMQEPAVTRTATGKPFVAPRPGGAQLHFNVSHSDGALLVALSRSAEVGVDVERVRGVPEWRAIAERVFDSRSQAELLAEVACGADEGEAFVRRWCRMEAAVKATGEGIFAVDGRDDANDPPARRATLRILDLPHLPISAGPASYRAALAICP